MINEIHESIWQIDSGQDGPVVALLGGTHGNERTGIEVVRKLQSQFASGERTLLTGTFFLVLGNLKAIELNQRGTVLGQDLNRMFYQERIDADPDGTFEDARMRVMQPILATCDISIDIHSTNKPSQAFLACASSLKHDAVTRWFTTDKIVADPNYVLGGSPVTTDEYVDLHGGIGVCYETGLSSDTSRVDAVLEDVLNVLRDQGMIDDGVILPEPTPKTVYELVASIVLDESGFAYTDDSVTSFSPFSSGDLLGTHGDGREVRPDFDGVYIFPKPKDHWKIGLPIGYLAKEV